jgi:hypothetical protein
MEPAEPNGKFEIRTTEEPARFWPAQKVSEVYSGLHKKFQKCISSKRICRYCVPMKNFKLPIAGVHPKAQKRCGRESGKCLNVRTQGNWKTIQI